MSETDSQRTPGEPEMTLAEIGRSVRRMQDDFYFGQNNVRVVLGRMHERFANSATKEDIANMKISMIKWYIGSTLALAGIVVAAFRWMLQ